MKFWALFVGAVVLLSGGFSALMVLNPNMQAPAPAAPAAIDDTEKSASKQPKAVPDKKTLRDVGMIGQHQSGQEIFTIRNEGAAPMHLDARPASCNCTSLFLSPREVPESEAAPLKPAGESLELPPGDTCYVITRWNSKEHIGPREVQVPVTTDDPKNRQINFKITLNIFQEVAADTGKFDFGFLEEGQVERRQIELTSALRDKVEALDFSLSNDFLKVRTEPVPQDALKKAKAKAGVRVIVETTGKQPVGVFADTLKMKVKTPKGVEDRQFVIGGRVSGAIETIPPDTVLDFREVAVGAPAVRKVQIFPRKLKEGETLKLGPVKPDFLTAKLEKHPQFKFYNLTVEIKPNAPGGPISNGKVEILDGGGATRLVFRVNGYVGFAAAQGN